ncbi:MAG TPA: hypothetical protein VFZ34_30915 [Blastocatellia bacterium]|nr:hypothetical protein [Blastocatellia bacterium]
MKKLLTIVALFAFTLVASRLVYGQATTNQPEAKRQWIYIMESNLKPGVANEYYEFRAKERLPALRKAGYKHQECWVSAIGQLGKLFTVELFDDLSIFGQDQNRLTKALGEEGARALGAKTMQYMDGGAHTYLLRSLPDLSWMPKSDTPPKFAIVAQMKIARGRHPDFQNYIKDYYLNVVKKSGALGYSLSQVAYGGDPSDYISVTYFNSFADLEKNDPGTTAVTTRVVGAEAAQKNASRLNGVMIGYERNILRFRPDLSILPNK